MIFRPTSGLDKGAGKAFWQRADQSQNVAHNKLLQLICFGFLAITAAFYSVAALAQSTLGGLLGEADSEILSPDVAFVLEALPHGDNQLVATFTIVEGHYLYRDKITFNVADDEDVNLDVVSLTEGVNKYDEFFGDVDVNRNIAVAELQLNHTGEARDITIDVGYQGCADLGICYPPQTKQVNFTLAAASPGAAASDNVMAAVDAGSSGDGGSGTLIASASSAGTTPVIGASSSVVANAATQTATEAATASSSLGPSEQDRLANLLGSSSLPFIFVLFIGLGVLLAFTPCVLPMVPILSGLIVGQSEKVTVARATLLSVIYVLFMALTYAVAGVLVALTGAGTGFLQNPWVLGGFAILMVVLSLSMFGMYELQMPQKLQQKLNSMSNSQKGGNFAGVAFMGFLSALIVGPCVTAPLVAALIFIADTGDAVVGGLALFALGLGMGLPLIAVGASCGHFLPKAGVWMERVKGVFGVLLLAMAIWMLSRFMPGPAILAMSAALAVVSGIYLGGLDQISTSSSGWQRLSKGGGILAMLYGAALLVGALSGANSLLTPLKKFTGGSAGSFNAVTASAEGTQESHELTFQAIKATDDLDSFLLASSENGQPVILDFYADWCVSCKEMEAFTFTDPKVMGEMSKAILLRADVTKNDKIDRALLKRFGLFGPPAILFFDPNDGLESRNGRVVGYMDKNKFYTHISRVYKDMALPTQAKQQEAISTAVATR